MTEAYGLEQYVRDLRRIAAEERDPARITARVAPLARTFAATPGWLQPHHRECDAQQGFGVHLLHEEPNHDLAVFLLSWLPDRGTMPHNHKTWAVVVGMEGFEQEVDWHRRDDGAKPGFADLERGAERVMTRGSVSCVQPAQIHSVWNVGKEVSMSLHTYGHHLNFTGRSEFDPAAKLEKPYIVKIAAPAET